MSLSCIDITSLAKYIGGKLSEQEKDQVEYHLSVCRECRTDLVSASLLLEEHIEPQNKLISIENASAVWEKFRHQLTRFYEWVIPSCQFGLQAVRSGQNSAFPQIHFSKHFDDLCLDFFAEKNKEDTVSFQIRPCEGNIKTLRIMLRKQSGKIVFSRLLTDSVSQNLSYGAYHLNVICNSQEKGNMCFEVSHAGISEG